MKAELHEFTYGFSLELTATDLEEATALVRFGLLRQKNPSRVNVYVNHPAPALSIAFLKNKNKYSSI